MHRRFVANAQAFRLSCYGTAAWTEGVAAVPKNGYIFMSSRGLFATASRLGLRPRAT